MLAENSKIALFSLEMMWSPQEKASVLSRFLYALPWQGQTNKTLRNHENPQLHVLAAEEMGDDLFAIIGLPWLPFFA